jgi:hypothetical protein
VTFVDRIRLSKGQGVGWNSLLAAAFGSLAEEGGYALDAEA